MSAENFHSVRKNLVIMMIINILVILFPPSLEGGVSFQGIKFDNIEAWHIYTVFFVFSTYYLSRYLQEFNPQWDEYKVNSAKDFQNTRKKLFDSEVEKCIKKIYDEKLQDYSKDKDEPEKWSYQVHNIEPGETREFEFTFKIRWNWIFSKQEKPEMSESQTIPFDDIRGLKSHMIFRHSIKSREFATVVLPLLLTITVPALLVIRFLTCH